MGACKIIPQPVTVAASGKLNLTFKFAGRTGAPAVRREAEEYWGNGVVLTRLPGIHTDGHAPSLEAAKAEFQSSWRQWPAWAKLGEVQ